MLEADSDLRALYIQLVDQEVELNCHKAGAKETAVARALRRKPLVEYFFLITAVSVILALFFLFFESRMTEKPPSGEGPVVVERRGTPHSGAAESLLPPVPIGRPPPNVPPSWSFDFEERIPSGWEAEFVAGNNAAADLPRDSQGALAPVTPADYRRN